MAQIGKVIAKAEIKTPAAKVYDFFKYKMTLLSKTSPQIIGKAEVIEGKEGQVGNVKLFEYVIGKPMAIKLKTSMIDDKERSITLEAIEGEVLQKYPSFKTTIRISEGCVEWCIEYEKADESLPDADEYGKVDIEVTKALDAYLLSH